MNMISSGEIEGAVTGGAVTGGASTSARVTLNVRVVLLPAASVMVMVNVFVPSIKPTVLPNMPPTTGTTLLFILTVTPVASLTEPPISMLLFVVVKVQPVAIGVAWREDDIVTVGVVVSMVNDQVLDQSLVLPTVSIVRTRQYCVPSANVAVEV